MIAHPSWFKDEKRDALLRPFNAGLDEELGALIVALDVLSDVELERVMEAAQMVDSEAQDQWEARRAHNTESKP